MKKYLNNKVFSLFLSLFGLVYNISAQTIIPLGIGTTSPNTSPTIRTVFTDTITNTLYIGGDFTKAGGIFCYGIAQWDGTKWDSLGAALKPKPGLRNGFYIRNIVRFKNEIYVTGNFQEIGGKKISGLARWNGTEWNNVGGRLKKNGSFSVSAWELEVYNNELYVSGTFDTIGTTRCTRIAKWDGSNWTNLGAGHHPTCYQDGISAIKHYQGELYVAGNVNCSFQPEPISKLVGSTWVDVGIGIFGSWVNQMMEYQGNLYVGGYFSALSGNADNNLFYINNGNYFGTAGGVTPSNCDDMYDYKGNLYVVGQINNAGGSPISRVAKWDGTQWLPSMLGLKNNSGQDGTALCLGEYDGKLVIAGAFDKVNGVSVNNIALIDFTTSGIDIIKEDKNLIFYPNPATDILKIKVEKENQEGSIVLYNLLGQLVYKQSNGRFHSIDVSMFNKGIYILEVIQDGKVMRQKVVLE